MNDQSEQPTLQITSNDCAQFSGRTQHLTLDYTYSHVSLPVYFYYTVT